MNTDRVISDWLRSAAPPRAPKTLLDATLERVAILPQDHPWAARVRVVGGRRADPRLLLVAAVVGGTAILGSLFVGGGGPQRGPSSVVPSVGLGANPPRNSQVLQVWPTNQAVAVTIQRQDATDMGRYYWRAVAYDQIGFKGWTQTNSTTIERQPDTQLFEGLAEAIDPAGLHNFTFTVTPGDFHGPTILSPGTPVVVNETTHLTYVGRTGYFAMLERDSGSGSYTVTAVTEPPVNALTQAELRVAGTGYPQEVKNLYLQVAPGSIGTNARKLEDKVRAEAASSAPFDLASQIVTELHSSTYTYATDVRDLDCATLSTAECFATYKRGFCQYYAATMAVLLRDLGVPTRIADGFLPGEVDPNTGIETIQLSGAHTWVEVYFPGHGWVMFDPTGGNLSQVEPLPSK
jgi:hypothetical protein